MLSFAPEARLKTYLYSEHILQNIPKKLETQLKFLKNAREMKPKIKTQYSKN